MDYIPATEANRSNIRNIPIFIVDGFNVNSQTFIREDFRRLSKEWVLIDILDVNFYNSSNAQKIFSSIHASYLILRTFPGSIRLLCTHRWVGVLHAYFIAARIAQLAKSEGWTPSCVRSHFLSKATIAAFCLCSIFDGSFDVVCHGSDLYSAPRSFNLLLRAARRIECVSFFGKGFVFGRLGLHAVKRCSVRRNAFRTPEQGPTVLQWDLKEQRHVKHVKLVGVGRLVPQKNFSLALRVVEQLCSKCTMTFEYTVVGDGPLRESLEREAVALGIEHCVRFVGQAGHDKVVNLIREAHALLLPCLEENLSDADGLPVVFQEALSLGTPVFCQQAFGVAEMIVQGVNGFAFGGDCSPSDWADTIAKLIHSLDRDLIRKAYTPAESLS